MMCSNAQKLHKDIRFVFGNIDNPRLVACASKSDERMLDNVLWSPTHTTDLESHSYRVCYLISTNAQKPFANFRFMFAILDYLMLIEELSAAGPKLHLVMLWSRTYRVGLVRSECLSRRDCSTSVEDLLEQVCRAKQKHMSVCLIVMGPNPLGLLGLLEFEIKFKYRY
jgi:hypothetical protein